MSITIFNLFLFAQQLIRVVPWKAYGAIALCAILSVGCQAPNASKGGSETATPTLANAASTTSPAITESALPPAAADTTEVDSTSVDNASEPQAAAAQAPEPKTPAPPAPAPIAPTPVPTDSATVETPPAASASSDSLTAGQKTITYYDGPGWDVMVAAFEPWSGEQNAGNFTLKAMQMELSDGGVDLVNSIDLGEGKITCKPELGACSTVWQDGNVSYALVEETSLEDRFNNGPTDTAQFRIFVGDRQVNQTVELQQERYPSP